jgi:hypothetical protein
LLAKGGCSLCSMCRFNFSVGGHGAEAAKAGLN